MISIIVAIAENNAIGKDGKLLCHMSEDLKYFKRKTSGKKVLMGSKTYVSLPKHPLPNRENIVITNQTGKRFQGAQTVHSITRLKAKVKKNEEGFVIGGGSIYKEMLPYADKLYITEIHHSWNDADTFFPTIDKKKWKRIYTSPTHPADEKNPYPYRFTIYEKR